MVLAVGAAVAVTAGCADRTTTAAPAANLSSGTPATTVNLGYFANVTHAGAILGVASGTFAKDTSATVKPQIFNAGPAEVEALLAGSVDAAYMGPSAAISGFVQSNGALTIVAGATEGGASLVVKPTITSPAGLSGKTIADPQLGNTQDVALKTYIKGNSLQNVTVQPQDNATTLSTFKQGTIDGAWVPEPYASQLVLDDGGSELVDERTLWPNGALLTTVLVVRTDFLKAHPQTVKGLIQGQVDADKAIAADPTTSQATVNSEIGRITGKPLSAAVLSRAFSHITPTEDPLATSLQTSQTNAVAAGTGKQATLKGILDLRLLDQVLARTVDDAGLSAS